MSGACQIVVVQKCGHMCKEAIDDTSNNATIKEQVQQKQQQQHQTIYQENENLLSENEGKRLAALAMSVLRLVLVTKSNHM